MENLTIEINSTNKELIQGKIPHTIVSGQNLKYQGLAVDYIHLEATSIHLNIAQMLKGASLRLLNPIVIKLKAKADRENLVQSLRSKIITDALGYALEPDITDEKIRSVLLELLASLQEEVTIEELEINNGLYCEAQLQIKAT